jgi:hypothetical protein
VRATCPVAAFGVCVALLGVASFKCSPRWPVSFRNTACGTGTRSGLCIAVASDSPCGKEYFVANALGGRVAVLTARARVLGVWASRSFPVLWKLGTRALCEGRSTCADVPVAEAGRVVLNTAPFWSIAKHEDADAHETSSIGVVSASTGDHDPLLAVGLLEAISPDPVAATQTELAGHHNPVIGVDDTVESVSGVSDEMLGVH